MSIREKSERDQNPGEEITAAGKPAEEAATVGAPANAAPDADAKTYVSLKNRCEDEQPREKLMNRGADHLNVAELFAILIGSGTKDKSAVELMQEILSDCNGKITRMGQLSLQQLTAYKGIGEAKAITLMAATELSRRRMEEKASDLHSISTAKDIYDLMYPTMRDLTIEECWVILLNNNLRVLGKKKISMGGRTETAVDPRVVLKEALLADSTAIILTHNHPSGSLSPSREDKRLTERIENACKAVGIHLIDHVIITNGDYFSFKEKGYLT